jgi:hypothetical protein
MRCSALITTITLALVPALACAQIAPGPYFARGTFYCSSTLSGFPSPPDSCWGYGDELQLFDDGMHGDEAAGDGVYGCWVTCNRSAGMQEFKIANADWSFDGPTVPLYPLINGRVFISGPGDVVHFRLDTSDPGYGWLPLVAVANDHGYPPDATLELMGSAPELGNWGTGLPADHVGSIWTRSVTISTPGTYEYKFRVLGTWGVANFGLYYNNNYGANGWFTTTVPNTEMDIQFDERSGRIRAIDSHNVPVRTSSWGRLKVAYR